MSPVDPAVRAQVIAEIRAGLVAHPNHYRGPAWDPEHDRDDLIDQILQALDIDEEKLPRALHTDCPTCESVPDGNPAVLSRRRLLAWVQGVQS